MFELVVGGQDGSDMWCADVSDEGLGWEHGVPAGTGLLQRPARGLHPRQGYHGWVQTSTHTIVILRES